MRVRCKPNTVRYQKVTLWLLILARLGKLPIRPIGRKEVTALHHAMVGTRTQANTALDTLSGVFGHAKANCIVPEATNPCRHVRPNRQRKHERFLTDEEFKRLGVALGAASQISGRRAVAAGESLPMLGKLL